MYICVGEVIGMNSYEKDGETKFYAQFTYETQLKGYKGKRACSCKVSKEYKIGDKVEIADDFRFPSIIER